nr:early nodulin-20-like [Lolium perenne]
MDHANHASLPPPFNPFCVPLETLAFLPLVAATALFFPTFFSFYVRQTKTTPVLSSPPTRHFRPPLIILRAPQEPPLLPDHPRARNRARAPRAVAKVTDSPRRPSPFFSNSGRPSPSPAIPPPAAEPPRQEAPSTPSVSSWFTPSDEAMVD